MASVLPVSTATTTCGARSERASEVSTAGSQRAPSWETSTADDVVAALRSDLLVGAAESSASVARLADRRQQASVVAHARGGVVRDMDG